MPVFASRNARGGASGSERLDSPGVPRPILAIARQAGDPGAVGRTLTQAVKDTHHTDIDGYLGAVRDHEHLHSTRMQEAIKRRD